MSLPDKWIIVVTENVGKIDEEDSTDVYDCVLENCYYVSKEAAYLRMALAIEQDIKYQSRTVYDYQVVGLYLGEIE